MAEQQKAETQIGNQVAPVVAAKDANDKDQGDTHAPQGNVLGDRAPGNENAFGVNVGGAAGGGVAAGTAAVAAAKLPPAERAALERQTDINLQMAYTAYSNAVTSQKFALREAASDSSDFILALLEVGLGLALPGVGRLAASTLTALARAPKAVALINSVVQSPEFGGLVTAVTKGATMAAKPGLPANQQLTQEDQFLNGMLKSFGDATANVLGQAPGLEDTQLAAICARFDRSVANEETYGAAISEMVQALKAMGDTFVKHDKRWGGGRADNDRYHWTEEGLIIQVGDHDDDLQNPLAVCDEVRGGTPSANRPDGYHLRRKVPESMRETAIQMCQQKSGQRPHRVHPSDLRGW